MALQGSSIWKLLFIAWTIWYQTIESSQLQSGRLRCIVVEVYCVVLWILFALLLEFLVDDNPAKHGLYSPGYGLPVYSSARLSESKPEYVLILGWQHQDSIIKRNNKFLEEGGKFIIPLPELKVLGNSIKAV